MGVMAERYMGIKIYRSVDADPSPGAPPVFEALLWMKLERGTLPQLRRKIADAAARFQKAKSSRWQDAEL
jgi:hypothetical protein